MAVRFVAYIDESGDTGLDFVKPANPAGSSEWLVISCFLVRFENDHKIVGWVKEIQSRFRNVQSPYLHYTDLIPAKKKIACSVLAEKPCRMFVTMSNKKNIEGYRNRNIQDGNKQWLYWWLTRLLLERVTHFCESQTPLERRGVDKLRVVFSRRGGMRYVDLSSYLATLRRQSSAGRLHIDHRDLCWSVIDDDEIFALGHKERAGLQFADIVAGSFYQAVERGRPADCDPTYAEILKPRIAFDKHPNYLGYGIKTMPALSEMRLLPQQRSIFESYGYSKDGW